MEMVEPPGCHSLDSDFMAVAVTSSSVIYTQPCDLIHCHTFPTVYMCVPSQTGVFVCKIISCIARGKGIYTTFHFHQVCLPLYSCMIVLYVGAAVVNTILTVAKL